jgi:hypothetical protein
MMMYDSFEGTVLYVIPALASLCEAGQACRESFSLNNQLFTLFVNWKRRIAD